MTEETKHWQLTEEWITESQYFVKIINVLSKECSSFQLIINLEKSTKLSFAKTFSMNEGRLFIKNLKFYNRQTVEVRLILVSGI